MVEFTGRSVDCINFKLSGDRSRTVSRSLISWDIPSHCGKANNVHLTSNYISWCWALPVSEARLVCCGAKTGKTLALNIRLCDPDLSNTANSPTYAYAYWPSTHPGGHTYSIYTRELYSLIAAPPMVGHMRVCDDPVCKFRTVCCTASCSVLRWAAFGTNKVERCTS